MRREISSPAVTLRQPRRRSALVALVVAAPPGARLVAPPGGAVELLVHAPEGVQSARIGGIGVAKEVCQRGALLVSLESIFLIHTAAANIDPSSRLHRATRPVRSCWTRPA